MLYNLAYYVYRIEQMDSVGKDILVGTAFLLAGATVLVGGNVGAAEIAQNLSQTFGAVAALGSVVPAGFLINRGLYYAGGDKWLKESSPKSQR
jgi:hypothetical protein